MVRLLMMIARLAAHRTKYYVLGCLSEFSHGLDPLRTIRPGVWNRGPLGFPECTFRDKIFVAARSKCHPPDPRTLLNPESGGAFDRRYRPFQNVECGASAVPG